MGQWDRLPPVLGIQGVRRRLSNNQIGDVLLPSPEEAPLGFHSFSVPQTRRPSSPQPLLSLHTSPPPRHPRRLLIPFYVRLCPLRSFLKPTSRPLWIYRYKMTNNCPRA